MTFYTPEEIEALRRQIAEQAERAQAAVRNRGVKRHPRMNQSSTRMEGGMVEQDWIAWRGGECPLPPGTMVRVRLRSGYEAGPMPAGTNHLQKFWRHERSRAAGTGSHDIIAWRPVQHH